MPPGIDVIHQGDCVSGLKRIDSARVDLAFADPPFNIGYEYDTYNDRQEHEAYLNWSREWMSQVGRVLKPTGTFWLAIGDEYAAELKLIAQNELGLTCRSWVVWYYTFGVNCTKKFSRSHAHLFYFVKDAKDFTFNDDAVRVPSARQLVYADARANPKGRLPDDTWILRPQDLRDGFTADQDTWYFPRVAGTFKERAGFHGCQMPEQLLGRIIRACSNPGELVLDPFAGSGTTLVVGKKLHRHWIGFELSRHYALQARRRLARAQPDKPLEGASDPLVSAPRTPRQRSAGPGRPTKRVLADARRAVNSGEKVAQRLSHAPPSTPACGRVEDRRGIVEAFRSASAGFSTDRILADPDLNAAFRDACARFGVSGDIVSWNRMLLRLRKAGQLPRGGGVQRTIITWERMDQYSFASEIALHQMLGRDSASLDEILCDPQEAQRFDRIASGWAPGFSSLEYRWAALSIRKRAQWARRLLAKLSGKVEGVRFGKRFPVGEVDLGAIPETPGLYLVWHARKNRLYLGETSNLRSRLGFQFAQYIASQATPWHNYSDELNVATRAIDATGGERWALQRRLVVKLRPTLNFCDPKAA